MTVPGLASTPRTCSRAMSLPDLARPALALTWRIRSIRRAPVMRGQLCIPPPLVFTEVAAGRRAVRYDARLAFRAEPRSENRSRDGEGRVARAVPSDGLRPPPELGPDARRRSP